MKAAITIGVPHNGTWNAQFGLSMLGLIAGTTNPPPGFESIDLGIVDIRGSILSQQRTRIVKAAMAMKATHVLFLDSDMIFPPHTAVSMLEKRHPIVACNCVTKSLPANPTARTKNPEHPKGDIVYQQHHETETLPVWRVGTGVMLVEMGVFRKIPEPWFPISWMQEIGDYQGEDWGFLQRAEAYGITPVFDVELSDGIGHAGDMVYTHAHVDYPDLEPPVELILAK